MESFTNIEEYVECTVQEAECCLGALGFTYANNVSHGETNEEDYWKMLQISNYIDALKRYTDEAYYRCGDRLRVINPTKIPCLNPQINSLPLGIEKVDCCHCLTEREVLKMIEVIKIFCSTCNCNCNCN